VTDRQVTLGLRANWRQFVLLIAVNACVGAMVGMERTVVPLIARADFRVASASVALTFLVSFGVTKALLNLFAGRLADRVGRKRLLVAGWLIGLPVPLVLILAPNWGWVVLANVLLGVNQALAWSMTVNMKIDLVGPRLRGLALGLNEFSGYGAVSLAALGTGFLAGRFGLRPVPFYPGMALALLGLALSLFFVRDTRGHVRHEAQLRTQSGSRPPDELGQTKASFWQIFLETTWRDRAMASASQAGLVKNLNDGMVWGLLPLFLASGGLSLDQIAIVVAVYPGVWGVSQLVTGPLSDYVGRKWLIASGLWVQACGIWLLVTVHGFWAWAGAAVIIGLGAGMLYPVLLAAVSDVANPVWRASSLGVYRMWRDLGYAVGGITAGLLADALNIPFAIAAIGGLTFLSGLVVAIFMYETLPGKRKPAQYGQRQCEKARSSGPKRKV
jgi:MFS family permease